MSDTSLQQVANGFDQAKKAIYDIMKKYFPKIDKSKSTLVHAFVAGLSWIYSMYQVFARLLQNELYVSSAQDLASLYALVPLVGIDMYQPIPMVISAVCAPQSDSITDNSDSPMYMEAQDAFADGNGYGFHQTLRQYAGRKIFDFSSVNHLYSYPDSGPNTGKFLAINIGKLLGEDYTPIAILPDDEVVIEFPYKDATAGVVKRGKIRMAATSTDNYIVFASSDAGSDQPSDIDRLFCYFYPHTGELILALTLLGPGRFNDDDLSGLPVNMTYKVRSMYRKIVSIADTLIARYKTSSYWTGYYLQPSYLIAHLGGSSVVFHNSAMMTVLKMWYKSTPGLWPTRIDPKSIRLRHTDGDVEFNFENAVMIDDPIWGIVHQASVSYSGATYYAYVMDEWGGVVAFEDPKEVSPNNFTINVDTVFGNKIILDQYDVKRRVVKPPTEFNFDNNSFVLEDDDPILFEELEISITDSGYTSLIFERVRSVVAVSGSAEKTYYETRTLAPGKIEIKFSNSVDYTTIENMLIVYRTVKNITTYKSGETLTGQAKLQKMDGTYHSSGGTDVFQFGAVNTYGGSGPAGLPTLATLRDTLEKAAYTLDRNVTKVNYEAAIQTYYLVIGWDARVKVFGYEDFGIIYLDSVNGNVVFFVGIVNRYPGSDLVLCVPRELDANSQNTRSEMDSVVPGPLTDLGLTSITPVGGDATEIDRIQAAIRDQSVLTSMLLSEGSGVNSFVRPYAIYFKAQLKEAQGFTWAEAERAVKTTLANLFRWSMFGFVRGINVSDTYRMLDGLPQVDRILFSNFSHYRNKSATPHSIIAPDGALRVQDIAYQTIFVPFGYAKTHFVKKMESYSGPFTAYEIISWAGGIGIIYQYDVANNLISFYKTSGVEPAIGAVVIGGGSSAHATVAVDTGDVNSQGRPLQVTATANKYRYSSPINVLSTGGNQFSVDGTAKKIIAAGAIWLTNQFYVGMKISITGFTEPENNVIGATVETVTDTELTLAADSAVVDEAATSAVRVKEYVNFPSFIGVGQRINVRGFKAIAGNNIINALVTVVSTDFIEINHDDAPLMAAETEYAVNVERMENPLWDFSAAKDDRIIRIDILGIGDIELERY